MASGIMGLVTKKAPELPSGLEWLNSKKPLSLRKLSGSIVILNFIASRSPGCRHFIQMLSKIENKYTNTSLLVINVYSPSQEKRPAKQSSSGIMEEDLNHPIIVDRNMEICRKYKIVTWPSLVIIGATGNVDFIIGGDATFEQLDSLVADSISKYETLGKSVAKEHAFS